MRRLAIAAVTTLTIWNGRRLTDWLSSPRIQLGFSIEGTFSDYHESREIWFWKVI